MDDFELEKYKAQLQIWVEKYKNSIDAGKNAIKMAFLINGGVSLALLTFIGTIFQTNKSLSIELFSSLLYFVVSIFLIGISSGIIYLTHSAINLEKPKTSMILEVITVLLISFSYLLFGYGVYNIYTTIT